ncbi:MAG: exodeoxyribonuclease V subunit beta, partial [Desulfuromonadales bacterium]|nr:exodeoxyribonuclease V subunit beta [Desulfuromonadales bacterium]
RQAGFVQAALQEAGIPSVMRSDKSLFGTHEAMEVFTLLQALTDPGNETKLRASLVTDIFGLNGNDIAQLADAELVWEGYLQSFREYHHLWLSRGVMIMAQTLLNEELVRGRLLRYGDGERRVTNLLHCFEVLHQQEQQGSLGLEGLSTWFGERIGNEDSAEEYQIRLETDALAVKIVTVHVSKGLEYPVVFCPFMWGGVKDGDGVVTCHDKFQIVKDYGSAAYDKNRLLASRESLAENLRLLYVALTRAKYRCYLLGGKITDRSNKNRPATSPLAYLFHSSDAVRAEVDDMVGCLAAEVQNLSATVIAAQLQNLADQSGGTIAIGHPPITPVTTVPAPKKQAQPMVCRVFSGDIKSDWRVASFTSLAKHDSKFTEQPDRDGEQTEVVAVTTPSTIAVGQKDVYSFPKGAQTGIFWHEIFENLNFSTISESSIDTLVTAGLEKYGHDQDWRYVVAKMVENVVTTKLQAATSCFSLAALKPDSWIAEMEFFFPLQFVTADKLRNCLQQYCPEYRAIDLGKICAALQFTPVQGMVRGFIDMVFEHEGRYYLLDWKSNHLGNQLHDYGEPALRQAMTVNLYPLQYLLYTVALHQYLKQRIPDYSYATHFGGVFYLFLRGMDATAEDQYGIFYDLPPAALINAMGQILIQSGGDNADG